MTLYYQGETVIVSAEITNSAGTFIDPISITCAISDPEGTSKASGAMTKDDTGKYHYDYNLAEDASVGIWTAEVDAVVVTRTVTEKTQFAVEA